MGFSFQNLNASKANGFNFNCQASLDYKRKMQLSKLEHYLSRDQSWGRKIFPSTRNIISCIRQCFGALHICIKSSTLNIWLCTYPEYITKDIPNLVQETWTMNQEMFLSSFYVQYYCQIRWRILDLFHYALRFISMYMHFKVVLYVYQ